MIHYQKHMRQAVFGLIACMCAGPMAFADERAQSRRTPLLPKYQQECSSCHVAYPPRMLPPASWQRLLNNLPRHYGTDASLDEASVKTLSAWLAENAGTRQREQGPPPDDRITRSPWFAREHHEVSAATWKRPAVKSASNCVACHALAEKGDFNEHDIRIPR